MYYIVTYDVEEIYCEKVKKILRKYLFHVQNSLFEGELTNKEFINLKDEIDNITNTALNIIYYKINSKKALTKEVNINYESNKYIFI